MSVFNFIEKWKDGTQRYVERDSKGRFKNVENKHNSKTKFYQGQKVGVWNNEPQQKIVPEINHGDYLNDNIGFECIDVIIRTLNFMSRKNLSAQKYFNRVIESKKEDNREYLHGKEV